MFDKKKLEAGLENLSGLDFELAEKRARSSGETTPIISLSSKFQLHLAAIALGENVNELKTMKIRDYNKMLATVSSWLFADSDDDTPAA